MNTVIMAIADGLTMTKRNTIKLRRTPDLLGSVILTPVTFVLLFAYVFGNMIEVPGISYREYMLPGVFTQTTIFGAALSGYILVGDLQKGIIERLRTLPMSPSAVLIGRTTSDLLTNLTSLMVMLVMGLIVGWRVHSSPLRAVPGCLLLLLFAYTLSWGVSVLALTIRTLEVYNNISTIAIFPIVFLANTFIDITRLPRPLQPIAEWNPVSAFTQAARELFGNTNPATATPSAWPLRHAIPASLLWAAVMLATFIPLATWRYEKAISR